jgi:hypothetical protein
LDISGHHILQFANVSRPIRKQKQFHQLGAEWRDRAPVTFAMSLEKAESEQQYVYATFTEWRHEQSDSIDPVIQIGSKRSYNDPGAEWHRACTHDPCFLRLAPVKQTQQLRLPCPIEVADRIEEQRSRTRPGLLTTFHERGL